MHTPAGLAICKSACDADPRCVGVEQGFNNEYGGECSKVFTLACPRNNNRPWTGARYTTFICNRPSPNPTEVPTSQPTPTPTSIPTVDPTLTPSSSPTRIPTADPSSMPTANPTFRPSSSPTRIPTVDPTAAPTFQPTSTPTSMPSFSPTETPTEPAPVCNWAGANVGIGRCQVSREYVTSSGVGMHTPAGLAICKSACDADPRCVGVEQGFINEYGGECSKVFTLACPRNNNRPWTGARYTTFICNRPLTHYPTSMPTANPTEVPTSIPTADPTSMPTADPTKAPTESPTDSPTVSPTQTPTEPVQERTGAGICADAGGKIAPHSRDTWAPNLASCKNICVGNANVGWSRLLAGSAAKPVGRCFCFKECRGFVNYPNNYFDSGSIDPAFGSTDVCTLGRMIAGGTVTDQAKRLDMKFMKFNEQDPYDDHFDQYWHNGLGRTTYVAQTSLWPEGCMS